MAIQDEIHDQLSRRTFLGKASAGLGTIALASLLNPANLFGGTLAPGENPAVGKPHFPPKVKRVIYLFQSGAPSQLELFDYKPKLETMWGQDLPASVRNGQRLTGMSAGQSHFPLAASKYKFAQHDPGQMWISELLPHTAGIASDLTFVRSLHTEAINHDPAITFFQTGSQQAGRPSFGSWISYGLGSDNQNLPAFVVLPSKGPMATSLSTPSSGATGFCRRYIRAWFFGRGPIRFIT